MRRSILQRLANRRGRSRSLVTLVTVLALAFAGLLGVTLTGSAVAASSDYTQSVSQPSSTQIVISFTPTTPAAYVDVHYLVNSANQQNFRMTNTSGTWTQTVSNLTTGNVVTYWFTYEKNGPQYDTPQFTYTVGSGATTGGTGSTGGSTAPAPTVLPGQMTVRADLQAHFEIK